MHFEHLVVIDEPNNLGVQPLTLDQLWNGLIMRAEAPNLFLDHIESVRILERSRSGLLREIQLGVLAVRDRITFVPKRRIHYTTEANDQHAGGSLILTIESPDDKQLFVRFAYDTPVPERQIDDGEVDFVAYLKMAYRQMDIESIKRIRRMAEIGQLGG